MEASAETVVALKNYFSRSGRCEDACCGMISWEKYNQSIGKNSRNFFWKLAANLSARKEIIGFIGRNDLKGR
ncbi:MAG: hypothetical protein Q8R40_05270 [bacterium]|nr:hypothetical protein [bacterium]